MNNQSSSLRLSVNLNPKELNVVLGALLATIVLIVGVVYRPGNGTKKGKSRKEGGGKKTVVNVMAIVTWLACICTVVFMVIWGIQSGGGHLEGAPAALPFFFLGLVCGVATIIGSMSS